MDRGHYPVRVLRAGEEGPDNLLAETTAEERLAMMWPLTVTAWGFKGEDIRESRLQRNVVRIIKRKG